MKQLAMYINGRFENDFNGEWRDNATMKAGRASGQVVAIGTSDGGASWVCGKAPAPANVAAIPAAVATNTTVELKWLPASCKI